MKQTVLIFGLIAMLILVLVELNKFSLMAIDRFELVAGLSGLFFLALGFVIASLMRSKKQQQSISLSGIDEDKIRELGISQREYEVLELIAKGHSNREIARALFISENTVKTHVSNLLIKLNASRRSQATAIARDLHII